MAIDQSNERRSILNYGFGFLRPLHAPDDNDQDTQNQRRAMLGLFAGGQFEESPSYTGNTGAATIKRRSRILFRLA